MKQYTISELAKNPRAIQVRDVKKQTKQIRLLEGYLDYKEENIKHSYMSAALRLLSSISITHDLQVSQLLKMQMNAIGCDDCEVKTAINEITATTFQKNVSELNDRDLSLAFKIAPIIVAFETGEHKLACLPQANKQTLLNLKIMLERTEDFLTKIENIKETNLFVYSQNQAICGVMDWITEDAIIELTAAPKKNLPLKSLRQSLFYYHLVSRQLQLTIENLVVFNPRFGIINHTEVKNISNELLQKIAHKLDSLDQFASVSLSDRLK